MSRTPPPAGDTARRVRRLMAGGLAALAVAVTAALLGHRPTASSTASSASPPTASAFLAAPTATPPDPFGEEHRGAAAGEADGAIPHDVTVFDDTVPAVARLEPALLKALRRAARAAADDGVTFYVNSGWRSPRYQDQLLREAVSAYGSPEEAARWVATATTSPHVSGEAVDIGRSTATAWLSGHGTAYGLCQIYRNEPWHYELRADAAARGCPRMYADPTEDPRMRQQRTAASEDAR
ncbi:peptidase M15 [Streptomyces sp. p1417]|uniref:Peptidase M15 n=1 Tax=Streptomyces typhae TaxID=2681492 RepID=A0A6L6X435_9ACTN|nr:D-alanyl-D-alanine carboxypeptidase family protein [Streptomyces typhae]MVO88476.1 peptidase M15 [Streptomyces typhae]